MKATRSAVVWLVVLLLLAFGLLLQPAAAQQPPLSPAESAGGTPVEVPPVQESPTPLPDPAAERGTIRGEVVAPDGVARAGLLVRALTEGSVRAEARTLAPGTFELDELPAGRYTLQLLDHQGRPLALLSRDSVELAPGAEVTTILHVAPELEAAVPPAPGLDAVAVPQAPSSTLASPVCDTGTPGTGSLSGTVQRAGTSLPIESVYVTVYNLQGDFAGSTYTDGSGNYTVSGLGTGSYIVSFDPVNATPSGYLAEWYDNQPDASTATLVSVTDGADTPNINARLARGARISGTVTLAGGGADPVYVYVYVYDQSGNFVGYTATATDGTYTTPGLPGGDYKLRFSPYGPSSAYLTEWYDDAPDQASADPVTATGSGTTTGIDATLEAGAPGGRISGTVTAADGGAGLANVSVTVYDETGRSVGFGSTNASGAYTTSALPTGEYRLVFRPGGASSAYLPEWYDDAPDLASADPVAVTAPDTTSGIDAELERGGVISGTVTGADGAGPLQGVSVFVYDSEGRYLTSGYTDASGNYTTGGLPSGSYRVEFRPGADSICDYLGEFYENKPDFDSADPVAVTAPAETAGIDAELARGSVITGRVTAADTGARFQDVGVYIYNSSGDYVGSTYTNLTGFYRSPALPSGSYRIFFEPPSYGVTALYISEYYNDEPDLESADPVALTAPEVVPNIDAQLERGGRFTGTVTGEGGAGLRDVNVYVYDAAGNQVAYAVTDASGVYSTAPGLPSGSYRLLFQPSSSGASNQYIAEWHNNKSDLASADPVALTAPGTTTVNAALAKGAQIKGKVTGAGGAALRDVTVYVYDADGRTVTTARTDAAGNYQTVGLASGNYRLYFLPTTSGASNQYIPEWHENKSTLASADPVAVTAPNVVTVNAALLRGGRITGRVTAADGGAGLPDVYVSVYDDSGRSVASATTNATGHYTTTPGLPTGSYRLSFEPFSSGASSDYIAEYYDDEADWEDADPVAVTAPNTTNGIDAELARGGRIAGAVTNGSGTPLAGILVYVYDAEGDFVDITDTDETGSYETAALRGGSYRLYFTPSGSGDTAQYIAEWHNNKLDLESADPVAVTPPGTVTVNAVLARGGLITGTVTGAGGAALPGVNVYAYDAEGSILASATTDASGVYSTTPGLRSGFYRLYFEPSNSGPSRDYIGEYHDDKRDLSSADPVEVTAPGATTVNAALARGGRIMGTVTGAGDAPLRDVRVYVYNGAGSTVTSATTGADGTYETGPLPAGSYRLLFYPLASGPASAYIQEYYDDKADLASADPVQVSPPGSVTANAALRKGAQIRGTVTAPGGAGLPDVYVYLYDAEGNYVASAFTNDAGEYATSPGLPPGSYRLYFFPSSGGASSGYIEEYYDDKEDLASADPIALAAGELVENVDAELQAGGQISGVVTGAGNGPLEDVYVYVYDAAGNYVVSAYTDDAGEYTTSPGLPSGNYRLWFYPASGGEASQYIPEYFNNKPNLASANPVSVSAPGVVTGRNAELALGAQIAGRVTVANGTPGGSPMEDVYVRVYDESGAVVSYAYTDESGDYVTEPGIPTGSYKVGFDPPNASGLADQFYNGESSYASADPVAVTAPDRRSGINAILSAAPTATPTSSATATGTATAVSTSSATPTGTAVSTGTATAAPTVTTTPAASASPSPTGRTGHFLYLPLVRR